MTSGSQLFFSGENGCGGHKVLYGEHNSLKGEHNPSHGGHNAPHVEHNPFLGDKV